MIVWREYWNNWNSTYSSVFNSSYLLTICLLNYNDYKITELGDKSLIIVKDDELIPTYKKVTW